MSRIQQVYSFPPVSGEQPKQLVILLHGYGSNGQDLIGLAPYFAQALPNAMLISPDAPFPCDMGGGGFQWFPLQEITPEEIISGVNAVAPAVMEFIAGQMAEFELEPEDVALVGFSQGTMTSLHVGLHADQSFAGILGYSGALADDGHLTDTIQAKPPVCLIHGEEDPVVPFERMSQAYDILSTLGIDCEGHPRPHLPHSIDEEGIAIGAEFLQRVFDLS